MKEHTGGIVTSGLIDAHDSVTPPAPLLYPLIGLTLMVPWPPLPAGTLLGETGVAIVMVNCGDTASTVRFLESGIVVLGEVPVTVMVYRPGVTGPASVAAVVMVAVAPPEGFTDGGLIVQTGRIAPAVCEVTRQLRSTVPLKPLRAADRNIRGGLLARSHGKRAEIPERHGKVLAERGRQHGQKRDHDAETRDASADLEFSI